MTTNGYLLPQTTLNLERMPLAENGAMLAPIRVAIGTSPDDLPREGNETNSTLSAELDCFDDEDRARGDRVRRIVALTVLRAIFEVGPELSTAFHKFDRLGLAHGRNSQYGKWLQAYLPAFDRKTLDRWRDAYEKFAPLLENEIQTGCLDFFNRFQLTAVYALCRSTVTDSQRREAIRLAQSGALINMRQLTAILARKASNSNKVFKKTIAIPAGHIKVSINHDDFRQALQEAIWQIDDEKASPRDAPIDISDERAGH
ncbi:MAG: hypothetical protein U0805_16200 [Pirellulales bacterium]